jgi:hypothetical protein
MLNKLFENPSELVVYLSNLKAQKQRDPKGYRIPRGFVCLGSIQELFVRCKTLWEFS